MGSRGRETYCKLTLAVSLPLPLPATPRAGIPAMVPAGPACPRGGLGGAAQQCAPHGVHGAGAGAGGGAEAGRAVGLVEEVSSVCRLIWYITPRCPACGRAPPLRPAVSPPGRHCQGSSPGHRTRTSNLFLKDFLPGTADIQAYCSCQFGPCSAYCSCDTTGRRLRRGRIRAATCTSSSLNDRVHILYRPNFLNWCGLLDMVLGSNTAGANTATATDSVAATDGQCLAEVSRVHALWHLTLWWLRCAVYWTTSQTLGALSPTQSAVRSYLNEVNTHTSE